ncbi:23S rRNA (uracil(1939)-C(5))-methyltransferase RlmD [Vagococcus acidifermentans]|uniref:23S rRNA (Uracil(1939)-C(5))-methyltransferase RlmD n=1 Tax=Vagococcus acidifermentans TaxID=564710 RepID=A0A430AZ18_9ENTE|nr:23S rRNA (uracil(1939)-C(5))-methyltransferase RlmD [Vagococcus acidifermentans]RSU13266.1 23S rRNA (uracil(1939)-C(5))-methyltransferase RlmD [Vagococcus acidifermentans]
MTKKHIPVAKNQTVDVVIEDLTHEGLGVGKVDGYPLFIENALPTEKMTVLVLKAGRTFGYAKCLTRHSTSKDRVPETSDVLIRTGIAPLHHLVYEAQLAFKQKQVANTLTRIGKLPDVPVLPTIGMENPVAYRNKAQIPVRKVNGILETGFFRKNSHDLVPITDFFIQNKTIDTTIHHVKEIVKKYQVKPYDETEHTGNLRHIIVRRGHYSGEIMVVLVTRKEKLFNHDKISREIVERVPEVVSIIQNINPRQTNVIMGKENRTLYGKDVIEDMLLGKTYQISANSFYQVNTSQAEVLYQTAIDFAEFTPDDIVVDAYCGIGTIALSLADYVKKVYGVEVIPEAVADARKNAARNQVTNAVFEAGKAETVFDKWVSEGITADVLVVDPPRKGLDAGFIAHVLEMAPKKIVYISCNPATLARDLRLFADGAYHVAKVQPVDLFPQTTHVELVALMSRVED